MDLETGLYHDNPEYDDTVDRLANDLFQISSTNGQVSELLRKDRKSAQQHASSTNSHVSNVDQQMALVQQNQRLFRQLKLEIEEMQQWENPTPSQKYSQHKMAADFSRLFVEFKHIQEKVLENARSLQQSRDSDKKSVRSGIEMEGDTSTSRLVSQPHLEQQQQLVGLEEEPVPEQTLAFEEQLAQDEVSYQQGLVAEREQEIENVAQGMNELNEIYMNLGTIVREQGVTLDNIEANLLNVASNVRSGAAQLTKAHQWQRRSSGKMCCFLIILLVIAAFLVLAVSL